MTPSSSIASNVSRRRCTSRAPGHEPDGVDEAGREAVGITAQVERRREPHPQVGRDGAQPAQVPVGADP